MTRARDLSEIVNSTGLSVDTDTLVVDSANNRVGIGTSTPNAAFNTVSDTIWFQNAARSYGIGIYADDANLSTKIRQINSGGSVSINTGSGGANQTTFDSSGNVGIGGAATAFGSGVAVLQLTGTLSGNPTRAGALRFKSQDGTSSVCDIYSDNGFMSFYTGTSTSTAEAMRIDDSGHVGIGVVPETWHSSYNVLQIGSGGSLAASTTNESRVFLQANTYTNASNVQSYLTTDEASQYWQNGGTHIFNVAPSGTADAAVTWTTAMTIDNSGNLLVGQSSTTIPGIGNTTAGVSIRGTDGSFFSRALGSGDTNNVVSFNRSTEDGNILGFQKDGTTVGSIGTAGGDIYFGNGTKSLMVSGNNLLPRDGAGGQSSGTVALGSANNSFSDLYLSGSVVHTFDVINNGTTDYQFSDAGSNWFPTAENDPILYLRRGETYIFSVVATNHPFNIRVSNGGAAYTTGVTNNGAENGDVVFKVPMSAPATLYYQCTNHSAMGNTINIV